MAKDKYAILGSSEAKEVVGNSALKETAPAEENEKVNFAIKGFPKALHDAIVKNKDETGNVNAFVRRACVKLAKEEGII